MISGGITGGLLVGEGIEFTIARPFTALDVVLVVLAAGDFEGVVERLGVVGEFLATMLDDTALALGGRPALLLLPFGIVFEGVLLAVFVEEGRGMCTTAGIPA